MKYNWLVVGLGNPEGKYFQTYHNVGFLTADLLCEKLNLEFKKKGNQLLASGSGFLILKPLTYMNLSGQAVLAVARKHNIEPENIVVICDDLHIDRGKIRLTFGGSGGGHNGLRSITELLKTDKYARIRIGIKPETEPHNTADYVLSKMDKSSREIIDPAIEIATQAVTQILSGVKFEIVQGKYNVKNADNK